MAEQQINGYRNLNAAEVQLINALKLAGNEIGRMIEAMERTGDFDQRWVAIGKTNIQQGFMALTRAIARPEGI
jgi:hypothetical protein